MPLRLPSLNVAIICDNKELETYDVKQDGTSSLTAFVASQAGKQFKVTYSTNIELSVHLYVDGQLVQRSHASGGKYLEVLGSDTSAHSILPFKFHELQLVDSDSEDTAPITPEMGTIEIKAYRCKRRGKSTRSLPSLCMREDLHRGHVSERSKKAGWHHVAIFGDEIPAKRHYRNVKVDYLDSPKGPPYASFKTFYRPRELLRAEGIILGNDVDRQGSTINNKKRAREDGSPGPSRNRPKIIVKSEELSGGAEQRIQAFQAELDALKAAVQSGRSVKRELRSPSPIVVGHSGEVIDLTLDE